MTPLQPPAAVEPTQQTRDPLLRPFARTSIWNTPIGTRARYVPTKIRSTGFGVAIDWFVVTRGTDPAVPAYPAATSGPDPCQATSGRRAPGPRQAGHSERLPRALLIPGTVTGVGSVPVASATFLQPDRTTLVTYRDTTRCTPGGPLYGRWTSTTSLVGGGIAGPGGSGLSGIGGSIRTGELTGPAPIRHVLKFDVGGRYLFHDQATGGARWPADTAGAEAEQLHGGSVRALLTGALLALPPRSTASRLRVRSAAGRKLLAALRDYGAYVVDGSGHDAVDLHLEHGAAVDYARRTGRALEAHPGLAAEVARMIAALAVVDDNAPTSIGGHGARRAPWAPPLRAPGARPSTPAAPVPVASKAPAAAVRAAQVADLEPVHGAPLPAIWAVATGALCLLLLGFWAGRRLLRPAVVPPRLR
ncbi:MAG: hypothetical protein ACXV1K_05250 [Kineosporiaceae bacterium]